MSAAKRMYGLSIIFSVLAFWIYFKAFQWISNQFLLGATAKDIISIIVVLIVIVPVSLMTGRKISVVFVAKMKAE